MRMKKLFPITHIIGVKITNKNKPVNIYFIYCCLFTPSLNSHSPRVMKYKPIKIKAIGTTIIKLPMNISPSEFYLILIDKLAIIHYKTASITQISYRTTFLSLCPTTKDIIEKMIIKKPRNP